MKNMIMTSQISASIHLHVSEEFWLEHVSPSTMKAFLQGHVPLLLSCYQSNRYMRGKKVKNSSNPKERYDPKLVGVTGSIPRPLPAVGLGLRLAIRASLAQLEVGNCEI
jgi:hypothetical protein